MKNKAECYKYFDKALSLEGDNYKAYICYAIAKSDFKDYDSAVELYKKAIEINPNELISFVDGVISDVAI